MKVNQAHLLLITLRRRCALIGSCIFLGVALAVVHCSLTARIYQANATLLVENNQEGLNKNYSEAPGARFEDLATQMKVIASPVVVDRALSSLQPFQLGAVLANRSPEERRAELAKNLSVTSTRNANLISLSYQSADPTTTTAIVSAIIDSYLKFNAESHRSNSREVLEILNQERTDLERQLDENDQQVLKLQQTAGVYYSSERERATNYEKHLSALEDELLKAQAARIRAAEVFRQVSKSADNKEFKDFLALRLTGTLGQTVVSESLGVRSDNRRFFDSTLESSIIRDEVELQRLQTIYGGEHPQVKALKARIDRNRAHLKDPNAGHAEETEKRDERLADLVRRIAAQELEEAQKIEQEVLGRITEEKALAATQNLQHLQLRSIETKGERLKSLYDVLLKRIKELDIGENLAKINVTVVGAPARRKSPIAPNVPMLIVFGLGAGLAVGIGMALVLERLDNKFRGPEDIQQVVGAPIVGTVPYFKSSPSGEPAAVSQDPNAVEAEAFRTIRTWLIFRKDLRVFCVSSPSPGDGKSTVISNLACTIASAGKRTLLIDADLRRPRVQHVWKLHPSRGLAYLLLTGQCSPESIAAEVCPSPVANLDLLPSGRVPANPGELLEKPEMLNLLQWARSHYDYVLIDSPPLIPVADGRTIARLVDGLMLVVRVDSDSRDLTYRATKYVNEAGGSVVCAIANRTDNWVRYGYYNRGDYGYGVSQEDVPEAQPVAEESIAHAA